MTVREILRMGDPRLLRVAEPVRQFGTPELEALIADMFETMHAASGAGLAAPQIGVNLQLVIFGFKHNQRYPEAPAVPETVLINPNLTAPATRACATKASTRAAIRSAAMWKAFTRAWCSTRSTTCWASCTRCGSGTSRASALRKCCSRTCRREATIEGRDYEGGTAAVRPCPAGACR
jgi:hypothetical protein